jgi:hypothetical protein
MNELDADFGAARQPVRDRCGGRTKATAALWRARRPVGRQCQYCMSRRAARPGARHLQIMLEHVPEKYERFSEKNMLKIKDVSHSSDSV